MAGFILVYLGTSPVMVLGTDLVVSTASPEKAGAAAAMSEMSAEFGIALGVAILGVVGTASYRSDVAAEVPAAAADLTRDTLAGARTAAEGLPNQLRDALLGPARKAFTNGLNGVSIICAVIAAALAFVAMGLLRHVRAGDDTPETTVEEVGAEGHYIPAVADPTSR